MTALPSWVQLGTVLGASYTIDADASASFPQGAQLVFVPATNPLTDEDSKELVWLSTVTATVGADGEPKAPDGSALQLAAGSWNVTLQIASKPVTFGMSIVEGDNYLTDALPVIVVDGDGKTMTLEQVIAAILAELEDDLDTRYVPGRACSLDGTDSLPTPTGVGLEFVIAASGLQDIRYNGTSL